MNESIGESKDVEVFEGRGGFREGSGRKPDWFKARCRELACSHHFFKFAERVFLGDPIEPRIGRTGVIYTEASVGDKVYLWEKLAGYGFGKPESSSPIKTPAESVANAEAALTILKMMEDVRRNAGPSAGRDSSGLDNRAVEVQAESPSA